ncbi:MAG: asparagine synthase (glutamine-hydrolyzing) [Sulfuricurvum sp.]|jgi:asparagine synthase (glutamine-hydrolysing)|uniref:asparagine synthase (glutamine-hydrolyzing) n=1 Tax=Sulfuricurvum sp. TaxID=2025608 RepID=UPI0025D27BE7|nr:asparagine synthase (glutamine-hydrolyzing) [Sulfuricurvum sp.]MCK9374070.1 asparagine synthase (glutamine-hydrolyzing) [Sulfuricurvum sp.]
MIAYNSEKKGHNVCGVFGIIGEYSPSQARYALGKLGHRGRDHCGIVEEDRVFFSHQRLSITDQDPRSHQPMRRGELLLSFNGEIYNHKVLRMQLDGYPWETQGDAEVVLAAFERWGIDSLHRLEGMFAFALLDGEKLYLVRDRFGKKPLFYHHSRERFVFSSEIKGIKPFLQQVRMNSDAMMSYLTFLAPTPPHTFYEGICKLEGGEWLLYERGEVTKQHYYDVCRSPHPLIESEKDALGMIEERLHRSLELRLDTAAPTAALLSGGIDSALLCALASAQGKKLETFTLGYDEYGGYDERSNARASAAELGLRNSEVVITKGDFNNHLDAMLIHMDEPLNDPAALPLYLLFQKIGAEGYKVVLSGEGSDELFLGYRQYFEYLDIEKAAVLHHKNWLKKYFHSHFSMNREWEWYKRIFDETLLFRTSGEKFTDLQKNMLLRRNVRDNESLRFLEPYRRAFDASSHTHPAQWYTMIDLKLFMGEHFLTKLDRVSMAHTIEARTPFLDHTLVETVMAIDPEVRIGRGGTKYLLKQVARRYLSEEILQRKKKGFANPYMEWLIASGRLDLIREVNSQTGLFHPEEVEKYLNMARRGRFKQHVWGLYVLSHWMQRELL